MTAALTLCFTVNIGQAEEEKWLDNYESPMDLELTHVSVQAVDEFKQDGGNNLLTPLAAPGRPSASMMARV